MAVDLTNRSQAPSIPAGDGFTWAWSDRLGKWVRVMADRIPAQPTPPAPPSRSGATPGAGQPVRGTPSTPSTGGVNLRDPNNKPTLAPGDGFAWAWNPTLNGGQWVRSAAQFRRENPTAGAGAGGGTGADEEDEGTTPAREPISEQSARAIIRSFLEPLGLTELEDMLYNIVVSDEDYSPQRLIAEVRRTPQYAARFPGMAMRQQQGRVAISEETYLADEREYRQLMQRAGLPAGFYDSPDDFARFIGGDVSPDELGRRIQQGYLAVEQADPSVKETLRAFYGVTDGELAAFFLDPNKAESLIMQQTAVAQIGAAAAREGFGAAADRLAAERMQRLGVTAQEAQTAYGALGQMRELLTPIERGETTLDVAETALGLTGRGGAEALQRLRTQQRRRVAQFEGGGRFATQGAEVVGLQQA